MEVTAGDQISPETGLQRARLCQEEVRRARQSTDSCRAQRRHGFPQEGLPGEPTQANRWRERGCGEEILRDENVQLPRALH